MRTLPIEFGNRGEQFRAARFEYGRAWIGDAL
jgi:hypothetical protein